MRLHAIVCLLLVIAGCSDLLGADFERAPAVPGVVQIGSTDAGTPDEDASVSEQEPSSDGGARADAKTTVPEPEPAPAGDKGCATGRVKCDDLCVSVTDPRFGCGVATCTACSLEHASAKCESAACAIAACSAGFADCNDDAVDGCETDTRVDAQNCGACGKKCGASEVCTPQGCASTCPAGTEKCGASCVDTSTSATNCGACGKVCPTQANADATCVAKTCKVECRPGFDLCGGKCVAPRAFYRDDDGDGFGKGSPTYGCSAPAGYVSLPGDCHDGNADVFPGQTYFFSAPYTRAGSTTKSFDFDCDGSEEIAYGAKTCPIPDGAGTCTVGVDGWCTVRDPAAASGRSGSVDPGCGTFGYECRTEPSGYGWYYGTTTQLGCR